MHSKTSLIHSPTLSSQAGLDVFLKLENLQPTCSFKIRGIGHICNELFKTGARHFVSASGGNAGYAVAYAGKQLNTKVNIFVPETSSKIAIEKIRDLGAEITQIGKDWDDCNLHALNFAQEHSAQYISPFNHPLIWQGNSSIIDELVTQVDKPDAIICSVGGGGLLCGIAQGLAQNQWQSVPIIAAETQGTRSLAASMEAKSLVTLDSVSGIATSLGSKVVAQEAFNWTKKHDIRSLVLSDEDALSACLDFKQNHNYLVEPACGVALAALSNSQMLEDMQSVVVIVCGGINTTAVTEALKIKSY